MENPNQLKNELSLKSGFTLVELAIVLVIIGLLVGGVLQGQELIKQANIRKDIIQIQDLLLSAETFRAKYGSYPGDLRNALTFFPDCMNDLPSFSCNGDGNDIIDNSENFYFLHHLSKASLTKYEYIPLNWSGAHSDPILNRFKEWMKFNHHYMALTDLENSFFFKSPGNLRTILLQFLGFNSTLTSITKISNDYVSTLDIKLDDGIASSGIIRVYTEEGAECIDGNNNYLGTSDSGICQFVYIWP
jgi:prepilin-type N-terminal cleavage/methylation domain-containing protein